MNERHNTQILKSLEYKERSNAQEEIDTNVVRALWQVRSRSIDQEVPECNRKQSILYCS